MITIRIPIQEPDHSEKGHAKEVGRWLEENIGKVTMIPEDNGRYWMAGEGWRFRWGHHVNNTWLIEFDDEKAATLTLLRWS